MKNNGLDTETYLFEHINHRVQKLEDLAHDFDKNIDRLIHNQEFYTQRLEKISQRLEKLETNKERLLGAVELLRCLIDNKMLLGFIFLMGMIFFISPEKILSHINQIILEVSESRLKVDAGTP